MGGERGTVKSVNSDRVIMEHGDAICFGKIAGCLEEAAVDCREGTKKAVDGEVGREQASGRPEGLDAGVDDRALILQHPRPAADANAGNFYCHLRGRGGEANGVTPCGEAFGAAVDRHEAVVDDNRGFREAVDHGHEFGDMPPGCLQLVVEPVLGELGVAG